MKALLPSNDSAVQKVWCGVGGPPSLPWARLLPSLVGCVVPWCEGSAGHLPHRWHTVPPMIHAEVITAPWDVC